MFVAFVCVSWCCVSDDWQGYEYEISLFSFLNQHVASFIVIFKLLTHYPVLSVSN